MKKFYLILAAGFMLVAGILIGVLIVLFGLSNSVIMTEIGSIDPIFLLNYVYYYLGIIISIGVSSLLYYIATDTK